MPINTGGIITMSSDEPADQLPAQMERMAQSIVDDRERRGVLVRQVPTQVVPGSTVLALSAWGPPVSGADPDGFFSSTDPFEPIVIPPGLTGYYLIEASYGQDTVSGTRGYLDLKINNAYAGRSIFTGDDRTTLTMGRHLSAGDRLKIEFFSQLPATTVPSRCRIEARRLGT